MQPLSTCCIIFPRQLESQEGLKQTQLQTFLLGSLTDLESQEGLKLPVEPVGDEGLVDATLESQEGLKHYLQRPRPVYRYTQR